jgi:hypothetical protein
MAEGVPNRAGRGLDRAQGSFQGSSQGRFLGTSSGPYHYVQWAERRGLKWGLDRFLSGSRNSALQDRSPKPWRVSRP